MAINSKFIEFATKAKFDEQLKAGNIPINSIVTIIDTKQLWIRGLFISDNNHTHDYLPITGGTLTGNLYVKKGNTGTYGPVLFVSTAEDESVFGVHKNGVLGAYLRVCNGATKKARFNNGTTEYDLYHAGNSNSSSFDWSANNFNAITAKVSGANSQLLTLNRTDGDASNTIKFQGKTITKHLGFYNGILKVGGTSDLSAAYEIWHDGNKGNQLPTIATNLTTSDLNTIQNPGFYYQDANVNATTARNYPVELAGTLIVTKAAGMIQTYIVYGPTATIYVRGLYSGTWHPWRKHYNSSNANLSTIDWNARSLNLYGNINHYSDATKFLFRVTKETNGSALWMYDAAGLRKSLFRGYAVDGIQLLLEAGGIQSAGEIFANNDKKVYHAGNSNLITVNWTADDIIANYISVPYNYGLRDRTHNKWIIKTEYSNSLGDLFKISTTGTAAQKFLVGASNGSLTWDNYTIYHSSNSNSSAVDWNAKKIIAYGASGRAWAASMTTSTATNEALFGMQTRTSDGYLAYIRIGANKLQWCPDATNTYNIYHSGNLTGNQTGHHHNELIGTNYTSGGPEKPNFFGASKLRYQMLGEGTQASGSVKGGIPTQAYSDAIWLSAYGADVPTANVLLFGKYNPKVGFRQQRYDATSWGAYYEFWHTGNFNPDDKVNAAIRSNWNEKGVLSNVVGQLVWKHHGNGHTIFDASNSVTPSGGSCSNTNPSVAWSATYPTLMGFNGTNTYGVRVDSARNADLVAGLHVHSGRNNEANKIVRTDSSGYIQAGYINSSSGNENNNSNPDRVWGSNSSDGYLRTYRTSALVVSDSSKLGGFDNTRYWMRGRGQVVRDHDQYAGNGSYQDTENSGWTGAQWVFGSYGSTSGLNFRNQGGGSKNLQVRFSTDGNRWDGAFRTIWDSGNSGSSSYDWASKNFTATGEIVALSTGRSASFGSTTLKIPSVAISNQSSFIQIQAGAGSATGSSGVIFHNPGISTAALEYRNTDSNTGYFNFKSDDTTWNLRVNGTAVSLSNHGHSSLSGITSLAFSSHSSDSSSISTTISGTATYFDFNLSDDYNNDKWRWRFTPSGQATFSAMELVPASNTTSNLNVSGNVSSSGFVKTGSSSSYLLKGDGDHYHVNSIVNNAGHDKQTGTGNAVTKDQFFAKLGECGLFNTPVATMRGSWWWAGAMNLDTGVGNLNMCGTAVWSNGRSTGSDSLYKSCIFLTAGSELFLYTRQESGYEGGFARVWSSKNFDPGSKLNTSGGTITGNLTINGFSKAGSFTTDETMSILPGYNNEINFGGYNTSTIYFGYRAIGTKPKPTVYVFGTENGTADVKAKSFIGNLTGTADTASNVMKSSWTDACIKVREHSNYTWLRNSAGGWVFQTGTTGDDWTQSFSIFSGSVASASDNSAWMEIGQRQSNATNGKYRGIRIRKYSGSSCVDGDLQVANVYAYTGAQFSKLNVDSEGKCYVNNTANRRAGMYGVYDSYKTGHIWSMGTAYMIPNDGSNFGNLYGLAYKHTNNTTGGTMAGGHQMVWCANGSPKCAIGDSLWTSGGVTAGTGFYKNGSTDSYLLLGGGGHKAVSDFASSNAGYVMKSYLIDATGLDQNTYYPVTMPLGTGATYRLEVHSVLVGYKPSWGTHSSGFSVKLIWESNGSGWGGTSVLRQIINYTYTFTTVNPLAEIGQMTTVSQEYVYVRGGGRYTFHTSHGVVPTLRTSAYSANGETVQPKTSPSFNIGRTIGYISDTIQQATGTSSGQGFAFNSKTAIGGENDSWLRLNPHAQFSSGVYLGSSHLYSRSGARFVGNVIVAGGDTYGTSASISLAIGDTDTGFQWNGDGNILLKANNVTVANFYNNSFDVINRLKAGRIECGYEHGVANSIGCSDWFRSSGNTGWYNATHGGGIYMTNSAYVSVSHNKKFAVYGSGPDCIYSNAGVQASGFYKRDSTDSHVLLGNGGHRLLGPRIWLGARCNFSNGQSTGIIGIASNYSIRYVSMGNWTITHNYGNTTYTVQANPYWEAGWNGSGIHLGSHCRIEDIQANSFRVRMVNQDNGNLVHCNIIFTMFAP